jgi:anti-sigma regulatory factor (Ser/Thr protein kinase)
MHEVVAARTAPPAAVEVVLPGRARSVAAARQAVAGALAGCPRADDLVLAVSELASNAIAWSSSGEGGTFTVRVRTAPRWARVEVADPGPAILSAGTGNGFGLALVAAVTDRSGHAGQPGGPRLAWAEVTWPGEPSAGRDGHHAR